MKTKRKFFICDFETTGLSYIYDFPIEIGCLILDEKFNIMDYVSELIFDPSWDIINHETKRWKKEFVDAYKVHKIEPTELLQFGKHPKDVCILLNQKIEPGSLMISDNISFDLNFMKKLYSCTNISYPFHYRGWDTNIILEGFSDIGDPQSTHRALKDCFLLYKQFIRFAEKINFFKE